MNLLRQAGLLCLLSAVPALVTLGLHPRRPAWRQDALAPGEVALAAAEGWGKSALWVDARSRADYEAGHVPGAVHLDPADWDAGLGHFLDRWEPGQKVVVYCSAASCHLAEEVAERLRKNRVEPVFVLKGGWETWLALHPGTGA